MIDCRKAAEQLFEYIDRELDEEKRREVENHIELCRACFNTAEFQQLLRTHLREATEHACPEKVRKRIEDLIKRF